MKRAFVATLAAAALAGCSEPTAPAPSMVAAPGMARETLHVPAGGYPLDTCVACGNRLGENGNPHIFMHEGGEVRLCCAECRKAFDADPASHIAKIREARSVK
jgi:hypothetical protein